MRILYFSLDYTTHDRRFLQALTESGLEMHFLRLQDDGVEHESRPLPDGVALVEWEHGHARIQSEDYLDLIPAVEKVVARLRPDVVHAGPVPSCGLLAALSGASPLVLMSWGWDLLVEAGSSERLGWQTRYALARADALICDADTVRLKALSILPSLKEKVVQFPWGVDLERFCPPASVSPHLREGANDGRIVLSTRAWENSHGIDILLEAFRLAHAEEPTLRLVLLGTGSLRNEVLEFVEESGLSNAVQAVGQVPEEMLPAYFQSADVYVSCARTDGTSVSLLQALAVGVPIVATDNPSNREWIIPERNGLLAEMGASSAVAKAILELGRLSQADRKLMGERNREVAESRADWPRNVQKLIATYERIMSARGR